jgi:hypothetical protein
LKAAISFSLAEDEVEFWDNSRLYFSYSQQRRQWEPTSWALMADNSALREAINVSLPSNSRWSWWIAESFDWAVVACVDSARVSSIDVRAEDASTEPVEGSTRLEKWDSPISWEERRFFRLIVSSVLDFGGGRFGSRFLLLELFELEARHEKYVYIGGKLLSLVLLSASPLYSRRPWLVSHIDSPERQSPGTSLVPSLSCWRDPPT